MMVAGSIDRTRSKVTSAILAVLVDSMTSSSPISGPSVVSCCLFCSDHLQTSMLLLTSRMLTSGVMLHSERRLRSGARISSGQHSHWKRAQRVC